MTSDQLFAKLKIEVNKQLLDEVFVSQGDNQGLYRSWKTWKVMEVMISISRPVKSWNSSEGHGKSWKNNILSENKKARRFRNLKNNRQVGNSL